MQKGSARRLKLGIRSVGLLIALLAFAACGGSSGEDSGGEASGSDGEAAGSDGGASGSNTVTMQNISFTPDDIEVSAGDTVTWVNEEESASHTVTAGSEDDPSGEFDSGNLDPGDTFEFTFEEPGTYGYYCDVHPGSMSGTVTVS